MVCGNIFKTLSIPNRKSQGAEILRQCSSHTMCHVSCVMCHLSLVTCHVSYVTCHLSCVICHMSHVIIFLYHEKIIGQSGGASRWRVCYQRGLHCLVFKCMPKTLQVPRPSTIEGSLPLSIQNTVVQWIELRGNRSGTAWSPLNIGGLWMSDLEKMNSMNSAEFNF